MPQQQNVIIAGSTGLIGSLLLEKSLLHPRINHVMSISRHPIKQKITSQSSAKLIQIIDPKLHIDKKLLTSENPTIGFITLGATKKKAGSKAALRAVDVDLVINVAKAMKEIGVKAIYIVSCIGASLKASSHYLRCKGEMEAQLEEINFEQLVFLQPGPLAGEREEPRLDERLLQGVMKLFNPMLKGRLLNYKPIEADLIANAMLHLAFQAPRAQPVQRFTSQQILALPI